MFDHACNKKILKMFFIAKYAELILILELSLNNFLDAFRCIFRGVFRLEVLGAVCYDSAQNNESIGYFCPSVD